MTRSLLERWSWLTGLYTMEREPLTLSFHSPLGVKSFPPQLILQLLGKIIHLSCISARSLNTAHNGHAPSSELGSRDCLSFPTCKTFSSQAFCWLAHNVKVKGICGESGLGCALPVQTEEQSKLEGMYGHGWSQKKVCAACSGTSGWGQVTVQLLTPTWMWRGTEEYY